MARGKFISFEGGEGGGKTTQAKLIIETLGKAGIEAVFTREPGGCPSAEAIRPLLVTGDVKRWDKLTEAVLFMAARRENLWKVILPALEQGKWVISDRFHDSTVAYQGYGFGLDLALLNELKRLIVGDIRPDLTIIFDLLAMEGIDRSNGRQSDASRHEKMSADFHERVREGYLEIAKNEPERCAIVYAGQSIEGVYNDIMKVLKKRFPELEGVVNKPQGGYHR